MKLRYRCGFEHKRFFGFALDCVHGVNFESNLSPSVSGRLCTLDVCHVGEVLLCTHYLWPLQQDKPAICKVCDKRGDKDRLLVCDNCLTCIHTFCLITPLASMPTGGWQCPSCIAAVRYNIP